MKLAAHAGHSNFKRRGSTEDVINNSGSTFLKVKNHTTIMSKISPGEVKVMNEYNESDGAINRAQGRDSVDVLRTGRTREGQLYLRRFWHANMVVTRDGIKKPAPLGVPRRVSNSFVAARNRHRNTFGNRV